MVRNGTQFAELRDLCKLSSGGTPSKQNEDYWGGDIPWISASSMHSARIYDSELKVTKLGASKGTRLVAADTLLILVRGSMLWNRIPICMTTREVTFNQDVKAVLTDSKLDSHFLFYFLQSQENYLLHKAVGTGIGAGKLETEDLLSLAVPLYSKEVKERVVAILSTWDKSIEATEKLLENSKKLKKALMQQLLTGKKRLPGFSGEWKEISLGDLTESFTGLSGKSKDDFGAGSPYVTYMSIFSGNKVDLTSCDLVRISDGERQNQVRYGDIFLTTSSETPEEVGMSSVLLEHPLEPTYLNSFCFGLRLKDFDTLTPEFASQFLRSASMRKDISKLAQGSTRFNLSKRGLLRIRFKLPAKTEQLAIASILEDSDSEIELLEHKLDKLKAEKRSLMQQLLTGKKRVKVEATTA